MATKFRRGDLVGGEESIASRDRCYYWRDAKGYWHPLPDGVNDVNEQRILADADIRKHLASGVLVRYPRKLDA